MTVITRYFTQYDSFRNQLCQFTEARLILSLASPAMGYWDTCPMDFQQYFFQLTSEPHKVYNSQLYLVSYSLSL